MQRRKILRLLACSSLIEVAYSFDAELKESPQSLLDAEYAVLDYGLNARSPDGRPVGRIPIQDPPGFYFSVSPNARSIALVRRRYGSDPLVVEIRGGGSAFRQFPTATSTGIVALSDDNQLYVYFRTTSGNRLILTSGEGTEIDLTGAVPDAVLSTLVGMRTTSNGQVLALAGKETFVLLDVPRRRVISTGPGHDACVSADGKHYAFVTSAQKLMIGRLESQAEVIDAGKSSFWGLGGWNAAGLLLAGATINSLPPRKLLAIDIINRRFFILWETGDDWGNRFFWISRRSLPR
jgi:hypothetical protein